MRVLVTGAAGFIGSHLCEELHYQGIDVIGLDCFLTDSYSSLVKRKNWAKLDARPGISLIEADLREQVPAAALDGVDVVVNEAGMPGLMKSWSDFDLYSGCNINALSNLISGMLEMGDCHLIQISTSSVYGSVATGDESTPTNPESPYGVTKLAAEELVQAYHRVFGLDFTILRYFSVYGPRQRPDMAYNKIIDAALTGTPIDVFGDGEQSRSNTYVEDCVRATVEAVKRCPSQTVMNIAGGERHSLNTAIELIESSVGRSVNVVYKPARPGDQQHTGGDIKKAQSLLDYVPTVGLKDGIRRQVQWQREQLGMS